ncbi:GNAT family N-acetyltransferase [Nocardia sp. IFM 10818]
MRIRPATAADLPILQDIEIAAGAPFRTVGMPDIAEDDPLPIESLDAYRRMGRAWVAVGTDDAPLAYLIDEDVDGTAHIAQVSVHRKAAHQGIGRRLLDHAAARARAAGLRALTLTTFTEVPWNAPYYERLGFHRIPDETLTPGLRKIRAHEAEIGLDRWPRTAMRRNL